MRLTPARPRVCVVGHPATDENAIVAAIAVARRTESPVDLLTSDTALTGRHLETVNSWLGHAILPENITVERRQRRSDLRHVIQDSLVLYTHGFATSPRPAGRRMHVNLWHGYGPKRTANQEFRNRIGANAIASNATSWIPQIIEDLSMRDPRVIPGNPREALMSPEQTGLAAERLNISAPYVLWLPTYRESTATHHAALHDGTPFSAVTHSEVMETLRRAAEDNGVTIVVKPHPLDSFDWSQMGMRIITDAELAAARVPFYGLIGAANGMVSDYSSVWVEFMHLNKPILLVLPDLAAFKSTRGLNQPNFADFMQPWIAASHDQVARFMQQCRDGDTVTYDGPREVLGLRTYDSILKEFGDAVATLATERRTPAILRRAGE
ncbi:CDP-glycerol glycerophosphotransferase family protein [Demequina sp. B12]|nr:CDP-glycerol glycerophosphotransferase family protein [Demequina sp. B12]MDE0573648.1 CDP-glycerol glycerophosphotransferase family protein [Demequina sp. B12]